MGTMEEGQGQRQGYGFSTIDYMAIKSRVSLPNGICKDYQHNHSILPQLLSLFYPEHKHNSYYERPGSLTCFLT